MTTSSQDQPTTVNTPQNQVATNRGRLWLRLLIAFIVIVLIVSIILAVLTSTKILPPDWFIPLLVTLSPIISAIWAYVKKMFSDNDVQQALKKRLIGTISGAAEEKASDNKDNKKDNKDAVPQTTPPQGITINFSPTITNTNTATSTTNTAAPMKGEVPTPPDNTTHPSPSNTIFFPSTKLTDPKEFYGRALEREQLLSRTRNGGCTSIIGPRRIGKTWLMTYLRLVAPHELGANFRIGHMIATMPSSSMTIAGFCREAVKALGYPPSYPLPERPDLTLLEHVVQDMVTQNTTPILCIDEFEYLTSRPECDLQFFGGLRAITEIGLVLVILSQKPLIEIVSESTKTSPFFNVFLQLPLAPFDRADAERYWQEKAAQAQFTEQERAYALAYSQTNGEQFPPLRLQLVGQRLLEEKYVADPIAQQRYRPENPEYWPAFKQRVDIAYGGMVKS